MPSVLSVSVKVQPRWGSSGHSRLRLDRCPCRRDSLRLHDRASSLENFTCLARSSKGCPTVIENVSDRQLHSMATQCKFRQLVHMCSVSGYFTPLKKYPVSLIRYRPAPETEKLHSTITLPPKQENSFTDAESSTGQQQVPQLAPYRPGPPQDPICMAYR